MAAARGTRGLAAAVGAADERLDAAVAVFGRQVPADLAGAGGDGDGHAGFLAFILLPRPVRPHAAGLSGGGARPGHPLLGRTIFHPPLLYVGYVGFSVAFAFAIAALLSGRLDNAFTRLTPVDAGGVGIPDAEYRALRRRGPTTKLGWGG